MGDLTSHDVQAIVSPMQNDVHFLKSEVQNIFLHVQTLENLKDPVHQILETVKHLQDRLESVEATLTTLTNEEAGDTNKDDEGYRHL